MTTSPSLSAWWAVALIGRDTWLIVIHTPWLHRMLTCRISVDVPRWPLLLWHEMSHRNVLSPFSCGLVRHYRLTQASKCNRRIRVEQSYVTDANKPVYVAPRHNLGAICRSSSLPDDNIDISHQHCGAARWRLT